MSRSPGWSRWRWQSPPALWRQSSGTAAPQHPRHGKPHPQSRTEGNLSQRDRDRGEAAWLLVPAFREQLESQELLGRRSKAAGIGVKRRSGKWRVQGSETPNHGTSPVLWRCQAPDSSIPSLSPHTLLWERLNKQKSALL